MCCFWSIHTKTYHDRLASRLSIFSTDTLGSFFFFFPFALIHSEESQQESVEVDAICLPHICSTTTCVAYMDALPSSRNGEKKERIFVYYSHAVCDFSIRFAPFSCFFSTEFLSAIDQINEIGDLVDCVHGVVMATISLHSSTFFFVLPMTAKNKHLTKKATIFAMLIRRVHFVF